MRFPGQRYDVETGLHQNYFRDYEPGLGRYVQSDPIGLRGGISAYSYVSNAPTRLTDPLGLTPPNVVFPGVSMVQNISEAQSMGPIELWSAVETGGKWDFKQHGDQYENFGNYHFGVIAATRWYLPGNMPNRGVGAYQQWSETSSLVGEILGICRGRLLEMTPGIKNGLLKGFMT